MPENDTTIKSLAKALRLLECFTVEEPELGITELAQRLGVTKSNAHHIVSTCRALGYIEQLPNRKYCLGLKMLEFSYIINQRLGYPRAVFDILLDAANATDQVVYFGLPYGTDVLYLYVIHPQSRLREMPYREILGERAPLYATGIGKAILSAMPEEEWPAHLPEVLTQYTPHTLTDADALYENLREARFRGYSIDNREHEPGCRCVGVPVHSSTGKLIGAISAAGPASVMTDEVIERCAEILQSAARKMNPRIYP